MADHGGMNGTHALVFEVEADGAVSGWVVGLPIYTQRATQEEAESALRRMLAAYLAKHP